MPRVPQEIIEQVAAANDIVEVIGGYFPLKRAGGAYRALCPFHRERTPSFQVNPQRQIFKCFGCGAGGSVFRFVMDYEHIDFMAAVRKLAERANIKIPEAEMSAEDYQRADLRRRLLALHAEATEFFHTQLMRGKSADAARDYLKQRGLSAEVAKSWKIGYAPDGWDGLLNHARSEGYSGEELAGSGLFSQGEESGKIYDRFRGRIMFPICNDTGEVIAFSGRVLSAEQSPAKYVNSPETMLFTKGAVLFGLHKSKRALIEKKQAIVCEGQIDLITAFENGVQNVIAPQGTAFTERQARILKRYVDEVVLCFDADAAGEKAAERSLPHLLGGGLLVRCAEMPPGEDPDSLIRKEGGEAFLQVISGATEFFEFQLRNISRTQDLSTARGKSLAVEKLAAYVRMLNDGFLKETVVTTLVQRLGLNQRTFEELIHASSSSTEKSLPKEFDTPTAKSFGLLLRGQVNRRSSDDSELSARKAANEIELDETHVLLALVALRHTESREWLKKQEWERLFDDGTPGSTLLGLVFRGEFRPDEPASLNAFLATLDPAQEATVSEILEQKLPKDSLIIAEDCWRELLRRDLERRRQVIEARLRNPSLPLEDYAALHAQVLALQQKLTALPSPRPPKLAE